MYYTPETELGRSVADLLDGFAAGVAKHPALGPAARALRDGITQAVDTNPRAVRSVLIDATAQLYIALELDTPTMNDAIDGVLAQRHDGIDAPADMVAP